MANRPIFIPTSSGPEFVRIENVEFPWSAGMAASQKIKNVHALHDSAKTLGYPHILEVSSKSQEKIGIRLSAFNLGITIPSGLKTTVECAFQGSKAFEKGGPFTDLYEKTSLEAKRDPRLSESGSLTHFQYEEQAFPLIPRTAFYDWLYLNSLAPHTEWLLNQTKWDGFSDIEFNPKKSINCQARSIALFFSLTARGLLEKALNEPDHFIQILSSDPFYGASSNNEQQSQLL